MGESAATAVKSLSPTVSIIMPSHMKPEYLPSSLDSVLAQTRLDFQLIVVDSGEWIEQPNAVAQAMAKIYARYSVHPLIEWVNDAQLPGLIHRVCPISQVVNRALSSGLARGKYVCVFVDDDLYHPQFIEKMAGFLDEHPEHRAVYCSQDRIEIRMDGSTIPSGPTIMALGPRTAFDNNVDFLQFMWHRSVLDELEYPWLAEDAADESCRHSDGTFMDRVAAHVGPVPNVEDILVTHRYTPVSTYSPSR